MSDSIKQKTISRRELLRTSLAGAASIPLISVSAKINAVSATPMRAAVIERGGQPIKSNIKLVNNWPSPVAGPGQVVVRTLASALNHLDLFIAWNPRQTPWVCGSDACGEIVELGTGVDKAWLGKRVLLNARVSEASPDLPGVRPPELAPGKFIGLDMVGTHAERFVAPISNLIAIEDNIDPVQAAAFPLTYLTAWRMLTSRAKIAPDQTLLLTGIGGGVASASLDIARHIGCEIIVTSRHQYKLDRARERGAHHTVLDEGQDWSKEVMVITGNRGVDVCADSVAKAVHMRCLNSLALGGTLVTCGSTTGSDVTTNNNLIFLRQLSYLGSSMGSMEELREVTTLFRRTHLASFMPTSRHAPLRRAGSCWQGLYHGSP